MANYPAHGLTNWDDDLQAYIDAAASPLGSVRRKLATDKANFKALILGDSKAVRANYPELPTRLAAIHGQPGMPFAGLTLANITSGGNAGLTATDWLAGNGTYTKATFEGVATTFDLIINLFNGSNRVRATDNAQATLTAETRTLLEYLHEKAPQAFIITPTMPTFTTTVVGTDYLSGASAAVAQARSDAGRQGILAVEGRYPWHLVLDAGRDVFGTVVGATSVDMADQIHPSQVGGEMLADYIAAMFATGTPEVPFTGAPAVGPVRIPCLVTDTGATYVRLARFNRRQHRLPDVITPTTADTLYVPVAGFGQVPLTGYTMARQDADRLSFTKAGADWTSVPANTVVWLVADHPLAGASTAPYQVYVDPASIAANSAADTDVTVTGADTNMAVVVEPTTAAGLPVGLTVTAFVSSANTVRLRILNSTGGAVDAPGAQWRFWLLR